MLISVSAAVLATSWSGSANHENRLRDVKMTSMLPRLARRRRRRHDDPSIRSLHPIHREGYETSEECWDVAPGP